MSDKRIDVELVKKEYGKMLAYNQQINLDETVKVNENFFIGKQWEGVQANGLPQPVFNFLKRVVLFTVASITTDNIKMQASPLAVDPNTAALKDAAEVVNRDFAQLFEFNDIAAIMREYMRNAAVDGDGCTYTYWDAEMETGQKRKGGIRTEILGNTQVGFGNPSERSVQKQPYILIEKRWMTDELKEYAHEQKCPDVDNIKPDTENHDIDDYKRQDGMTTVILRLWKDKKTRTVWACECTENVMIRKPWDTKLKRYPVTWLNWDYVRDSYHGAAMVTGLIPNQIYINKMYAMVMISTMTTAFPKVVYDRTRVGKWNNAVGAAIGIQGGDVNSVAKIMDPAHIDPQINQMIQLVVEQTQTFQGATSVAMGDTRPDNTSAIIALQRAAATPQEITKQNLYRSIEDLGRIYLDFMAANYGTRDVKLALPADVEPEIMQFAQIEPTEERIVAFNYAELRNIPMSLKLDVGASSYWSEQASMQTLDNLLMQNKITLRQYLERLPDGYIPMRQELITEIKSMEQQAMAANAPAPSDEEIVPESMEVHGGAGYGELQRAINETGEIPA